MNRPKKRSSARAARFAAAHGMSEGQRRSINKSQGPKKDILQWQSENSKFSTVSL